MSYYAVGIVLRGRPKTRRETEGNQYLYPHETTAAAAAIYLLLLLVLLIDCEWTSDGRAARRLGRMWLQWMIVGGQGKKDVSGVQ